MSQSSGCQISAFSSSPSLGNFLHRSFFFCFRLHGGSNRPLNTEGQTTKGLQLQVREDILKAAHRLLGESPIIAAT